jgi:predicted ArsR family transcriptional regulator
VKMPSVSIRPREDLGARASGVASLGDPVRRALYGFVAAQRSSVNRDQAAQAVGVARHVARFHLDKLVEVGLLETEYRRPPGRGGPGAGRPAKHYRRSSRELVVSVPERRYDLAGWLLARALNETERDQVPVRDALVRAARDAGESFGADARARAGPRPSRKALAEAAREVLVELGYEPRSEPGGVELANCPFHALAEEYTDLVCGMNLELLGWMLAGLGPAGLEACPDPAAEGCCVRLQSPPRPRSAKARAEG